MNERNMLKFRKIAFCITKFSSQLDNIIDYLTKFEMKVFVSLSIATDISFKTLVSDAIKGVLALDDYDLNSEFIKFILDHNKLIISDNCECSFSDLILIGFNHLRLLEIGINSLKNVKNVE